MIIHVILFFSFFLYFNKNVVLRRTGDSGVKEGIMVSEAQIENVQENILPLHGGRELVNQFGA